jgi:hypothetical protein
VEAAKKARYLDLVPAEAFVDRRNPEPLFIEPTFTEAAIDIVTPGEWEWGIPDFPELPGLAVCDGFADYRQKRIVAPRPVSPHTAFVFLHELAHVLLRHNRVSTKRRNGRRVGGQLRSCVT